MWPTSLPRKILQADQIRIFVPKYSRKTDLQSKIDEMYLFYGKLSDIIEPIFEFMLLLGFFSNLHWLSRKTELRRTTITIFFFREYSQWIGTKKFYEFFFHTFFNPEDYWSSRCNFSSTSVRPFVWLNFRSSTPIDNNVLWLGKFLKQIKLSDSLSIKDVYF